MSACDIATLAQVTACEAQSEKKANNKELQEIKRREIAAKIEEKRKKIEELRAELRAASKKDQEDEDATTDTGSCSDSEHDAGSSEDESPTEAPNKLCGSAKVFYPPPPGLEDVVPMPSPPGFEELTFQAPPGLETTSMLSADAPVFEYPFTKLSANAKAFQYECVRVHTKLTSGARMFKSMNDASPTQLTSGAPIFKSVTDASPELNRSAPLFKPAVLKAEDSKLNRTAPLFQPAALNAEAVCNDSEKITWLSSRRRA